MANEFNLSEKIYGFVQGKSIPLKDVKEFIKILKEEIASLNNTTQKIQHKEGECSYCDTLRIIDKRAGERLK